MRCDYSTRLAASSDVEVQQAMAQSNFQGPVNCASRPRYIRGMDALTAGRNVHWGLVGIGERAENVGAQFRIWIRPGAGTEVELLVPGPVPTEAYA